MIAFLHGLVARNLPNQLWVEAGGVGYDVQVPVGSFEDVPVGHEVRVLTHMVVREDSHTLYGFRDEKQRELFALLLGRVSGIGPKLALAVLSGMRVEDFKAAVVAGDAGALSTLNGVGKKTAERIIFELKDKVGVADAWKMQGDAAANPDEVAVNEAMLALLALGYKQVDAVKALKSARGSMQEKGEPIQSDNLIRSALRILN